MKENQNNKSEKGQIVILLALAFVGILAFAALAIDGAMIYSDRRIAQNGADAASVSGAQAVTDHLDTLGQNATYLNWDCSAFQSQGVFTTGNTAAITHAGVVDFSIDDDLSDNNGVNTQCFEIDNGTYEEKFIDVYVKVTDDTPTSFLHLISNGTVRNQVEVKTRVYPKTEAAYGMTLLALNEDDDKNGLEIKGGPRIDIEVGGIVSNSYLKIGGTGPFDSEVLISEGDITYQTTYEEAGLPTVSPTPTQSVGIDDPDIPFTGCIGPEREYDKFSDDPMNPGNYSGNHVISYDAVMNPGLYCIDGNLTINADVFTATHVTLYMENGSLSVTGGLSLHMSPPESDGEGNCLNPGYDGCPPAIPGVLIYVPHSNVSSITINGNTESTIGGTIYAPTSHVTMNGNGTIEDTVSFGVQVIADTIKVSGTANLDFNYTGEDLYIGDITLEVAK